MTALYLAYGSNLHPIRLQQRVPSATLLDRVRLPGCRLAFNKRGQDGSGKCNIRFSGETSHHVFAAVYSLKPQEIDVLDRFEGAWYEREQIAVEIRGKPRRAFAYVAPDDHCSDRLMPFGWYQQLVFWGARFHGFPRAYLDLLQGMVVVEDDNAERRALNQRLVDRMKTQIVESEFQDAQPIPRAGTDPPESRHRST